MKIEEQKPHHHPMVRRKAQSRTQSMRAKEATRDHHGRVIMATTPSSQTRAAS
jgi:hypothetical protein